MHDDPGRDVHLPSSGDVLAAAVVLHPHPGMGGDRHHPLVVAIADALAAQGVATVRPDVTDPSIDGAAARVATLAADFAAEAGIERVVLVGYSWGSLVAASAAPAGVEARILIAPPVTMSDLSGAPAAVGAPALVLVPAHDQYGPPEIVEAAVAGCDDVTVERIEGADHFLTGAVARVTTRTADWLAEVLAR